MLYFCTTVIYISVITVSKSVSVFLYWVFPYFFNLYFGFFFLLFVFWYFCDLFPGICISKFLIVVCLYFVSLVFLFCFDSWYSIGTPESLDVQGSHLPARSGDDPCPRLPDHSAGGAGHHDRGRRAGGQGGHAGGRSVLHTHQTLHAVYTSNIACCIHLKTLHAVYTSNIAYFIHLKYASCIHLKHCIAMHWAIIWKSEEVSWSMECLGRSQGQNPRSQGQNPRGRRPQRVFARLPTYLVIFSLYLAITQTYQEWTKHFLYYHIFYEVWRYKLFFVNPSISVFY